MTPLEKSHPGNRKSPASSWRVIWPSCSRTSPAAAPRAGIAPRDLETRFGPRASRLLGAIARLRTRPRHDARAERRMSWFLQPGHGVYRLFRQARGTTRPTMRSFAALVPIHVRPSTMPLLGYNVVAMQHLLGSTVELVRALEASGVSHSDVHLLGKRYSQYAPSMSDLEEAGSATARASRITARMSRSLSATSSRSGNV